MGLIKTVNVLVSEFGEFKSPPDLAKLYETAPKVTVTVTVTEMNWDGEMAEKTVVDRTSISGAKFYARERELLNAIAVIETSGTMRVVSNDE